MTVVAEFQALIVGVIGFAGVMMTLLYNAKVARDQRRDERHHEREALRTALIEELQIHRQSLQENRKIEESAGQKSSAEAGGALVPTDPMDDAYRVLLPRIGLLSQPEVAR